MAAILANAPPQTAVPTPDLELALREWDQFPNVFRRLVQIWVLKYDSRVVLMEDARGLSYIARLLHDVLGRHLRNSISPGLTFCYNPERDPNWLTSGGGLFKGGQGVGLVFPAAPKHNAAGGSKTRSRNRAIACPL